MKRLRLVLVVGVGVAHGLSREAIVGVDARVTTKDVDLGARAWLELEAPQPYTVACCSAGGGEVSCVGWELHAERLVHGASELYGWRDDSLAARCASAATAAARDVDRASVAIAVDRDGRVRALAAATDGAPKGAARVVVDATGGARTRPRVKNSAWCDARRPVERAQSGYDEILLRRGDDLLEGLTSNLFALDATGALWTAPDDAVLPGVGRAIVLDAAERAGLRVVLRPPRLSDAGEALGFLLSNANGCRAVAELATADGARIYRAAETPQPVSALLDAARALEAAAWTSPLR